MRDWFYLNPFPLRLEYTTQNWPRNHGLIGNEHEWTMVKSHVWDHGMRVLLDGMITNVERNDDCWPPGSKWSLGAVECDCIWAAGGIAFDGWLNFHHAVVQMVQRFGSLFVSFSCKRGFVEEWHLKIILNPMFFLQHFPCQNCHFVAHSIFENPQHVLSNMDFVSVAFAENSRAKVSGLRYFDVFCRHRNRHRTHLAT